MKTSTFGDPLPASQAEMNEAFEWNGTDPGNCYAQIEPPNPGELQPHFQGWTASVRSHDGDEIFDTCAFPTEDALREALSGAGIPVEDLETLDAA